MKDHTQGRLSLTFVVTLTSKLVANHFKLQKRMTHDTVSYDVLLGGERAL
jgi:hypothetical protein